jgi:PREDICTED: similar to CG30387 CG30387-PB
MLRRKFDSIKLILQVCFGHPPMLNYDHISALPVRFLFTEAPIKISSDYSVSEMVSSILSSLWISMENQIGFLPIRLYRVFLPEHGKCDLI